MECLCSRFIIGLGLCLNKFLARQLTARPKYHERQGFSMGK